MSVITPKRLITPAQLTTGAVVYYTTPVNTKTTIKKLTLTNSTVNARTVTLHLVPSGGTADATNVLLSVLNIAAHTTIDVTEASGHTLETGSTIQALADAATAVTIQGSGFEVS